MTANELRNKSSEELENDLRDFKDTAFNIKFRRILGQLEDTSQLKKVKKDIARIHTILRLRELGIEESPVTSDRMDKTVAVEIVRTYQHPLYKKIVRRSTKILAHDEQNECNVGDLVQVVEVRPVSRRKRWKVREIVSKTESIDA